MSSYLPVALYHTLALPGAATAGISDATIQSICDAVSTMFDSRGLCARYALPLVSWDLDLQMQVACVANYLVLLRTGFNPENPTDKAVAKMHDAAWVWLDGVAGNVIQPNIVDSGGANLSPDDEESPSRGWKEWGTGNTYGPASNDDESEV